MDDTRNKLLTATKADLTLLAKELGAFLIDGGAQDVKVIDVRNVSNWCSFIAVGTFASSTQGAALLSGAMQFLRGCGFICQSSNSSRESSWHLLDAYDFTVNLFTKEARDFYALEDMWFKGSIIYEA